MTMEEVKPLNAQVAEPVKANEGKFEEKADAATTEEKNKIEESESVIKEKKKPEEPIISNEAVERFPSLKEESNFLSDLKDAEKKALAELKAKLEEAIVENKLFKKGDPKTKANREPKAEVVKEEDEEQKENQEATAEEKTKEEGEEVMRAEDKSEADSKAEAEETGKEVEEISLWRVPLLPSKNSDATDVLLLKFLRAREFRVKETLDMLKNTLQWRRDAKIDSVLDETELGNDFGAACYMEGLDREGHPVCYNVSAVFQQEEVYKKAFGSKEGRERFLRWRVQLMEKGIQKLDMRPGGVSKLLQITDLKDSVGPSKKELRDTMKQALQVLQDNYPEFVERNIFINVPFWYYAFYALLSPFMTQRTKSKFVVSRSSNVTETLLKYIPAESIPIQYGGFKRENDTEFSVEDGPVSELIVKASSTETIEIAAPKAGTTAVWDLTVVGWDVNYKEEFIPTDEGSYTIIVQKVKKMGSHEEKLIRNSFRNDEPGKIVLVVENNTSKKKKVLFRYKTDS